MSKVRPKVHIKQLGPRSWIAVLTNHENMRVARGTSKGQCSTAAMIAGYIIAY